jgi:hypothetical protein
MVNNKYESNKKCFQNLLSHYIFLINHARATRSYKARTDIHAPGVYMMFFKMMRT